MLEIADRQAADVHTQSNDEINSAVRCRIGHRQDMQFLASPTFSRQSLFTCQRATVATNGRNRLTRASQSNTLIGPVNPNLPPLRGFSQSFFRTPQGPIASTRADSWKLIAERYPPLATISGRHTTYKESPSLPRSRPKPASRSPHNTAAPSYPRRALSRARRPDQRCRNARTSSSRSGIDVPHSGQMRLVLPRRLYPQSPQ